MALPTHLDLQIVTPDRLVVQARVDEVQVPGLKAISVCCRDTRQCWRRSRSGSCGIERARRRPTSPSPPALPRCCRIA